MLAIYSFIRYHHHVPFCLEAISELKTNPVKTHRTGMAMHIRSYVSKYLLTVLAATQATSPQKPELFGLSGKQKNSSAEAEDNEIHRSFIIACVLFGLSMADRHAR